MNDISEPMPALTWSDLEIILLGMASTDAKRQMVRHLLEGTRKQARFMTPSGVMTELFFIAFAMLDAQFTPAPPGTPTRPGFSSSSASPPALSGF